MDGDILGADLLDEFDDPSPPPTSRLSQPATTPISLKVIHDDNAAPTSFLDASSLPPAKFAQELPAPPTPSASSSQSGASSAVRSPLLEQSYKAGQPIQTLALQEVTQQSDASAGSSELATGKTPRFGGLFGGKKSSSSAAAAKSDLVPSDAIIHARAEAHWAGVRTGDKRCPCKFLEKKPFVWLTEEHLVVRAPTGSGVFVWEVTNLSICRVVQKFEHEGFIINEPSLGPLLELQGKCEQQPIEGKATEQSKMASQGMVHVGLHFNKGEAFMQDLVARVNAKIQSSSVLKFSSPVK